MNLAFCGAVSRMVCAPLEEIRSILTAPVHTVALSVLISSSVFRSSFLSPMAWILLPSRVIILPELPIAARSVRRIPQRITLTRTRIVRAAFQRIPSPEITRTFGRCSSITRNLPLGFMVMLPVQSWVCRILGRSAEHVILDLRISACCWRSSLFR